MTTIENHIQSDNRKFRSRPLVGRKVRHCTGDRKICRKNHGAGRCLGKFSLLGNVWHLSVLYIVSTGTDAFQGYQTSVKQCLRRVQYSSFPPEGVTGTSGYRNLHLIKCSPSSLPSWKSNL